MIAAARSRFAGATSTRCRERDSCLDLARLARLLDGGGADVFFRGLPRDEASREAARAENQDAVRVLHDFGQIGTDQDHGGALAGQLSQQAMDLGFGADIDPARRARRGSTPSG